MGSRLRGNDTPAMTRHRIAALPYGPDAWLLRFADEPGEAAFQAMRAIARERETDPPPGLLEYVPGYTSVLVEFVPGTAPATLKKLVARLGNQLDEPVEPGPIKDIPVIYDGPDLPRVAEHTGLTITEVCERHAAKLYRVALIGFAPGFPYLEGLEPALHTPRLDAPRPRVEAGSVAIGGGHTGIYSIPGPGGWNLIGHTAVRLFDPARAMPGHESAICLLQPGDQLRFVPERR
jgi:KipI family sensor histidine kinase inhibitor